jgi:hypothetical protein
MVRVTVAHEAEIWTNPTSGFPVDLRIGLTDRGLQRDSRNEIRLNSATGRPNFLNIGSYCGQVPCTLFEADIGLAVKPAEMDKNSNIDVVIRFITPPFDRRLGR